MKVAKKHFSTFILKRNHFWIILDKAFDNVWRSKQTPGRRSLPTLSIPPCFYFFTSDLVKVHCCQPVARSLVPRSRHKEKRLHLQGWRSFTIMWINSSMNFWNSGTTGRTFCLHPMWFQWSLPPIALPMIWLSSSSFDFLIEPLASGEVKAMRWRACSSEILFATIWYF